MHKHQIVSLHEIAGDVEFYRGTRFRQYAVGLRGVAEQDDYYEYMLVDDDTTAYMLLVNISSEAGKHKAGNVPCYVQRSWAIASVAGPVPK